MPLISQDLLEYKKSKSKLKDIEISEAKNILGKDSVKCLFEPESVAIVGASEDPEKFGYHIMRNLIDMEFRGKIYPV
ncbi:CoA-binding protein, partial [Candidatus Bathyarchaeota archaeon]|nr:CoA-binding protein [Candidatus Bathyarchaeota archaeon]